MCHEDTTWEGGEQRAGQPVCAFREPIMDLDRLIAALSDPAAYPHAVDTVDVRQTHISAVFLAGPYVYKVKKPVDLGFLDDEHSRSEPLYHTLHKPGEIDWEEEHGGVRH